MMALHIEDLVSEVAVFDGDLPLSEAQTEKLVRLVLARLAEKDRDARRTHDATALRHSATPPLHSGR
jgi:hypothetical protein